MHRVRRAIRTTFIVVLEQGLFEAPNCDLILRNIAIVIVVRCLLLLLLLPSIETAPDLFLGRAARLLMVDTELLPLQVLSRFALLGGQRLLGVAGVEHVQDVSIVLSLGLLLLLGMQVLLTAPGCSHRSGFRCFFSR